MDYPRSVPGVGLVNGLFVNEDPATGQLGSIIPAEWGNALMSELFNVMAGRGVTPDEAKVNQLAEVIFALATTNAAGMVQLANSAEATAGANTTKAITPALLKQEIGKIGGPGDATEAARGIIAIATAAEAAAGTNSAKAITPALLKQEIAKIPGGPGTATTAAAGVIMLATAAEAAAGANTAKAITPVLLKQETDKRALASHTHTTAQVAGLDAALAGKAAASHTHTTAQVSGLDAALAGKAATSHTHTIAQISGLQDALMPSVLGVGSYFLGYHAGSTNYPVGSSISASQLTMFAVKEGGGSSSSSNLQMYDATQDRPALTGTWRNMGPTPNGGNRKVMGLWQRIA